MGWHTKARLDAGWARCPNCDGYGGRLIHGPKDYPDGSYRGSKWADDCPRCFGEGLVPPAVTKEGE